MTENIYRQLDEMFDKMTVGELKAFGKEIEDEEQKRTIRVPVGSPYKSWRAYAIDKYIDEQVLTGCGYSAPNGLERIGDQVFIAAKAAKKLGVEITWEEVKEFAPPSL